MTATAACFRGALGGFLACVKSFIDKEIECRLN